jgi:hypothetical protein
MQKVVMILSCMVHLSRACGDCTRAHEGKLTGGKLGSWYTDATIGLFGETLCRVMRG